MDSAIEVETGLVVSAEELPLRRPIVREGYVCRGCPARAVPCSFDEHNKVRPYFRIVHHPNCNVDGEADLIARGRANRLSDERNTFPGGYPHRLVFQDERPVVDPAIPGPPRDLVEGRPRGVQPVRQHRQPWSVKTIRPLCRHFIRYPYDRHLPLEVPGAWGDTFNRVFWRIQAKGFADYPLPHLFYVPIRWNKPVVTDEHLEILLDAGLRESGGRLTRPCRAQVRWATWSQSQRNYVQREIEISRDEATRAHTEGHKNRRGWLFFVGQQDAPDLFTVRDHRLICCLVEEMTWPKDEH